MNKIAATPKPVNVYDKLNKTESVKKPSMKPPIPQQKMPKTPKPIKQIKLAELQGTKQLPPIRPSYANNQMIQQENEMKMQGLTPAQYRRQLSKGRQGIAAQHRDTPPAGEQQQNPY